MSRLEPSAEIARLLPQRRGQRRWDLLPDYRPGLRRRDFDLQRGPLLFQLLEDSGELDNTLVLWTSDHGEFLGDYDCFGKRSFLDSAARIPMIARYPERLGAGICTDALASLVDVMPTFLSAAGIDTSKMDLDGCDLAELAEDPSSREMIWGQHHKGALASYTVLT